MPQRKDYSKAPEDNQYSEVSKVLAEIALKDPIIKIDRLCKAFGVKQNNVQYYLKKLREGGDTK